MSDDHDNCQEHCLFGHKVSLLKEKKKISGSLMTSLGDIMCTLGTHTYMFLW